MRKTSAFQLSSARVLKEVYNVRTTHKMVQVSLTTLIPLTLHTKMNMNIKKK